MKFTILLSIAASIVLVSCGAAKHTHQATANKKVQASNTTKYQDSTIFQTAHLTLKKLSEHTYQHISYLNTKEFGRVECNGMLVVRNGKAIIFDTPADDESTKDLIEIITKKLDATILAVIPTHFHEDCVGGIASFVENHVPIYASNKTISLLKNEANKYASSIKGFDDSLTLDMDGQNVTAQHFGEGHTKDNIVGYYEEDNVMFGGCLIKEIGAGKGNLADANVATWSATVARVKAKYPQVKIVIPGHGKPGGIALLDYTAQLFQ